MAKTKVDPYTCFIAPLLLITGAVLHEVMTQVIKANAAFIENLNRAQLYEGKRADGSDISPDYTQTTEFIKQSKGQRSDRVTLRDTGAFYESIFVEVFRDAFDLSADDPKTAELKAKYQPTILGLTEESKQKLIVHIRPQFVVLLRIRIGL